MRLSYSAYRKLFYVVPDGDAKGARRSCLDAGFNWHQEAGCWVTSSPVVALGLLDHADQTAREAVWPASVWYETSRSTQPDVLAPLAPAPKGREFLPFQQAGIQGIVQRFEQLQTVLLADPMGLGKTVQAIGVANALDIDPSRILVVCPASMRLVWKRELESWMTASAPVTAVVNGYKEYKGLKHTGPLVISYNLTVQNHWVNMLRGHGWDLMILDEAHYLKNPTAKRTKASLGQKKAPGLLQTAAHSLLLTGTPIPNRPHEFYTLIKACCPTVVNGHGYWDFLKHYCTGYQGTFGYQVTGARNTGELASRLRGTGWMIRRSKESVLPDLPPKRYNLVVFPPDSNLRKIVEREQAFDAREIMQQGVPVGVAALPELRHEMGRAKTAQCLSWISDTLENTDKLVVWAHHRAVIEALESGLQDYCPVVIHGGTPPGERQANIDRFQQHPDCRVFIGQLQAASVGITLTAASDVAFVEADWVPGNNEQAIDRCHRIGQEAGSVNIYYLVVEGSLDAQILGAAASKAQDALKILT